MKSALSIVAVILVTLGSALGLGLAAQPTPPWFWILIP
jgi:hypothetical protein